MNSYFLPVTPEEVQKLGWDAPDFVYVTGDAYVDHPSFGSAIISRVLEDAGYRVAMLPQPDWHSCEPFRVFGKPRLGFLVSAGVIDSMVNHYTVAKKRRGEDVYSPGGRAGLRPDRATSVYCNRIREAYGSVPILIGGIEASLRRFAHYDYWDDRVRNSILVDSAADLLMYGMGEHTILKAAEILERGGNISQACIPGTCTMRREPVSGYLTVPSMEETAADKRAFAEAFIVEYREQDPVRGRGICQKHGARYLCQHPPDMPLTREELDRVYALPYTRTYHPMYENQGGIPALSEVEFSIASCRGCFGSCNFCALTFHQGRIVTSRSEASIVEEGRELTGLPGFKGYIHDVGGPTANFRHPACKKQLKTGTCADRQCLFPKPCPNLNADHREYLSVLKALRSLPKVRKVFVRSGIRYDYLLADRNDGFLRELIRYHVSGQLKVAPEHVSDRVLSLMGKPKKEVFLRFAKKYEDINREMGSSQYLVPYFMSSHPGSTLDDAIELAVFLKESGMRPQQVQDFYPTPGTLSTCMFHTGLDPRTMEPVYVSRNPHEKAMQRALMQYFNPKNRKLVLEALRKAGREDLIGHGRHCLVPNDPQARAAKGPGSSDERDRRRNGKRPFRDGKAGRKHPPAKRK